MLYYKEEILNCLNLSDFCYEKDDSSIINLLNENVNTHNIEKVIRGEIESSGQIFVIGYREKDINSSNEFKRRNTYYVSCKGTDFNYEDITTDLNSFVESREEGTYHKGFFNRSLGFPIQKIIQWLKNGDNVIFSGHSLGGSVSQILTITIILNLLKLSKSSLNSILNNSQILCITFGSPLVGNLDIMKTLVDNGIEHSNDIFHSFIHRNDPIPKLKGIGEIVKRNLWSITMDTVCWLFNWNRSTLDESTKFFYKSLPDSSQSFINSKTSFISDLNSLIGTYHIVQHINSNNSYIKSLSYKNDSIELNQFFNFSLDNILFAPFHKLKTYRDILVYELITSKVSATTTSTTTTTTTTTTAAAADASLADIKETIVTMMDNLGIKTNKVSIMIDLIPIINSVSIKNEFNNNKLMIIDGENLCFIPINSLKLIYNDGFKIDILVKSIIQKGYNQMVIDITDTPINGLKSLQFKSNFKYNNRNVAHNQHSIFEIEIQ
ncbi:hypothetical protein RB653_008089 [Dictyostelium firmibasis]|uniref:Fungal lipase-type domain-containing protein n=1 Tax=Dictyostelium firmibasis TaxID=79012 RepID=A0AAN7UC23_9MYCE